MRHVYKEQGFAKVKYTTRASGYSAPSIEL